MRKTKRFTPTVIARFYKQGRGTGTHETFLPWHRVTRGDPSSSGRSHLLSWRKRLRELLSDGELGQQLFAAMLPNLDDCLEQFPLKVEPSPHPLTAYGEADPDELLPGTEALAKELGIRHPELNAGGDRTLWTASTDFVLVLKRGDGRREMVAIAFKPLDVHRSPRKLQLLRLEREYWLRRGVTWLLVTPKEYEQSTLLTLRRTAAWALGEDAHEGCIAEAARIARLMTHGSLTTVLKAIAAAVGDFELAQRAFWQAVWRGVLPIDLRRSWRPHLPIRHITPDEFGQLNPLTSRRSAWI